MVNEAPCLPTPLFNWKKNITFFFYKLSWLVKGFIGSGQVRGNSQTQAHLLGSHKGYTSYENPNAFAHNVNKAVDQVKM